MDIMSISALGLGALGERIAAQRYLDQGYEVRRAPVFYGDLEISRNGEKLYIEVKTIRTMRATVRKPGSQHLAGADFVLVYHVSDKGIDEYLIPADKITTSRIYVSPTSQYGEYRNGKITDQA